MTSVGPELVPIYGGGPAVLDRAHAIPESASIDDRYRDIFGPGTRVELDMDNSFAVRPSVELEYAITPKVAVTGTAAFFFTKIDSRLVTPGATYDDQWNASSFLLSAGVLIYPFQ